MAEDGGAIRRRRSCPQCQHRFTTYERLEELPLMVVKSDGTRQAFSRDKVLRGLQAASKGRPVLSGQLIAMSESVEDQARLGGTEISSGLVGTLALEQLRSADEVAYLRFASVYKNFDAATDFVQELYLLQKLQTSQTIEPGAVVVIE